jgi:hypothetical protein
LLLKGVLPVLVYGCGLRLPKPPLPLVISFELFGRRNDDEKPQFGVSVALNEPTRPRIIQIQIGVNECCLFSVFQACVSVKYRIELRHYTCITIKPFHCHTDRGGTGNAIRRFKPSVRYVQLGRNHQARHPRLTEHLCCT